MPRVDHECSLLGFVTELADRLAKLEHENAQLKKSLFGARSERSKLPRVKLGEPPTPEQVKATRRARAEAKAETPTVRIEHKVPEPLRRCTACGRTDLTPMGPGKSTFVWEFVPAKFVRLEHVQEVLRCSCGGCVVTAPGAPKVVEKGKYGASFLAHIAVAKCADHLPIYRLEKELARKGVPVARSTMNELLHRASALLAPVWIVEALNHLRLYGCLARIDEIRGEPWLERVMTIEREERTRRSLVHRTHIAGVGAFKPLCDFDWAWPKGIDRAQVEDLFSLRFIADGENVILVGPNGVGKTMILRNLAHRALHDGRAVVVRTASDLLADLAKQESSVARARRLEAYVRPQLLCIDEVGYLSYDVRHADLLFEVVARRHEKKRAIVLTTNKAFAEWHTTFPNASCVVALVDRLINRADIVAIDGDSYRLREAEERQKVKASARRTRKDRPLR